MILDFATLEAPSIEIRIKTLAHALCLSGMMHET